jgi:TRAP-type transport system small permease protein
MKLTKLGQSLGRAIDLLARKMVWLSAVSVLAVFALVVVDVIGRYFFNHPVKGSNDIGEVILVLIAYLAVAYTQLNKEHVRVTLLWGKLPPKGKLIGDGLSFLFGAFVYALIAWNLGRRSWRLIAGTYASSSETPVLGITHIPFLIVAVFGAAAFVLVLTADSVRAWVALWHPAPPTALDASVNAETPATSETAEPSLTQNDG